MVRTNPAEVAPDPGSHFVESGLRGWPACRLQRLDLTVRRSVPQDVLSSRRDRMSERLTRIAPYGVCLADILRKVTFDSESSLEPPAAPPPRSLWRKLYQITDHQVIGGVIVAALLALPVAQILGWWDIGHLLSSSGSGSGSGSGRTYSGPMTIGHDAKDIDAPVPTNVPYYPYEDGLGDFTVDYNYWAIDGAAGTKMAPYPETGTPAADRCSQLAQVNGLQSVTVEKGRWICMRSAKGAVAAFRPEHFSSSRGQITDISGDSIVWRHS
jgi:hypothetical protein